MTLDDVATLIRDTDKRVQLIYAFNGTGKTQLSRKFKELVAPKGNSAEDDYDPDSHDLSRRRILYYNAFTEDLFHWDNDLEFDADPKLRIQPNVFTDWILRDRGQDQNIVSTFQRYANDKLTPLFIEEDQTEYIDGKKIVTKTFPEVVFTIDAGGERPGNIKISKGEESSFIWSVFFTLLTEAVGILSETDPVMREDDLFDELKYVFIDDPVSSLDDGHLIELAVDLARLIKSAPAALKFIITTHNPLFYNVLHNEFGNKDSLSGYASRDCRKYRLSKLEDATYGLLEQPTDRPFSYHLHLITELKHAIESGEIRKYHFNFLRNVLEKTATFLGYKAWGELLEKSPDGSSNAFAARLVNLSSHSAHAGEEIAEPEDRDKEQLIQLVASFIRDYKFRPQEERYG